MVVLFMPCTSECAYHLLNNCNLCAAWEGRYRPSGTICRQEGRDRQEPGRSRWREAIWPRSHLWPIQGTKKGEQFIYLLR
jgi:hypothetical protein